MKTLNRIISFWIGILISFSLFSQSKIYWVDDGTNIVHRSNLDGTSVENILINIGFESPKGIAIDQTNDKIYWVDSGSDKIHRCNFDGTTVETLATGLNAVDIALDVSNNHMYWVDEISQKVQRANLDGTSVTDLVTGLNAPRGIDLDLTNNKIYWCDDGTDQIHRSDLDGNNSETLLATIGLSLPKGIGVDNTNNKLYWVDSATDRIQRANKDGTSVETILTLGSNESPSDIFLDISGNLMYWTEALSGKIVKSDLNGGSMTDVVTGLVNPRGLFTDKTNSKIYWSDIGAGEDAIYRSDLNGANKEKIVYTFGMSLPQGVEIDETNNKVYWAESGFDRIFRANLDGSIIETLVTGLSSPRDVALDLTNNKLYWIDAIDDKITQADLDGSNVTDIVTTNIDDPKALEIDPAGGKIYWIDDGLDKIQRADVSALNSNIEDVVTTAGFAFNKPRGLDLDLTNSKVYWSDDGPNLIAKADMAPLNSNVENVVSSGLSAPQHISLDIAQNKLYWTDAGNFTLKEFNLSTMATTTVADLTGTNPFGCSVHSNTKVYWSDQIANGQAIKRINVGGSSLEAIVEPVLIQDPQDLDVDVSGGKVYYSDANQGKIFKCNLNGTSVEEIVSGLTTPIGISLDLTNNKVFWLDQSTGKVQQSNLDGTTVEDLVTGLTKPVLITADPANNTIFWTDETDKNLRKANLDGSSPDVVLGNVTIQRPLDVRLDVSGGKMYWCDSNLDLVYRANLNGTGPEILLTSSDGLDVPITMDLDLTNNKIYLGDSGGTPKILKSNLDGSSVSTIINSGFATIQEMVLDVSGNLMYWSDITNDRLYSSALDGSGFKTFLYDFEMDNLEDCVVDVGAGKLFITDLNAGKIYRSDVTGANFEDLITGLSAPYGITLYGNTNKLYWVESGSTPPKIRRANIDGTSVEDVVSLAADASARGIAIGDAKIFWSDSFNDKIQSSELDGSNVTDVVTSGLSLTTGIAFDEANSKIFWVDAANHVIQKSNLDGTSTETVKSGLSTPQDIFIDKANAKMYWTEDAANAVKRADLDGNNTETLVTSGVDLPQGIALDQSMVLPVDLSEFNGRKFGNSVILEWKTQSEFNNKGFQIQRKTDFSDWEDLGFINGNGNAQTLNYYTFTDENPAVGMNFYRLQQEDFDGGILLSKTVSVFFESSKSDFRALVYPNPNFDSRLFVNVYSPTDEYGKISIFNRFRKQIYFEEKHFFEGNQTVILNLDSLTFSAGIYLIKIEIGRTVLWEKMIKV